MAAGWTLPLIITALATLEPSWTKTEAKLMQLLINHGQKHLFSTQRDTADPQSIQRTKRLLQELQKMHDAYPTDEENRQGLHAYIEHAKQLLEDSKQDKNPFAGYTVSVPRGETLDVGSDSFRADERLGTAQLAKTAFVLVAGGLGERLGFPGIKVSLPAETLTEASFLECYCRSLVAIQNRAAKAECERPLVPLVIMTSDDTHALTEKLLLDNANFGLLPEQVFLLRQSNVPALSNNAAAFAVDPTDPFSILTKPHGHGDVHTLLHQSGLLPRFMSQGLRYVAFFQDTNVLAFKGIPAALGVSERLQLDMNSLAVPRAPKEAAGAICQLTHEQGEKSIVINVEYNQLDSLLRAGSSGGDTADAATGYSPFPGNTNTFVVRLEPYESALRATGGAMPEFVNPKYANAERTIFKKPTRLECMMQDLPKLLQPDAKVGFTTLERWFSFSPVKNSIQEALKCAASDMYPASPGAGEAAVYCANAALLRLAGAAIEPAVESEFLGLPLALSPAIALSPNFALTVDELYSRIKGRSAVRISARSSLVLDGEVTLESLDLDGALCIHACPGAYVRVCNCNVHNSGWAFEAISEVDSLPEAISIRGYRLVKFDGVYISIDTPGQYEVTGAGQVHQV